MTDYGIFMTKTRVLGEVILSNVVDLASQLPDQRHVVTFHPLPDGVSAEAMNQHLEEQLEAQTWSPPLLSHDRMLGFNSHYKYGMLSSPTWERGLIQIVDNCLIYTANLSPLHRQKDSYMFIGFVEYHVPLSFDQVLNEFRERGFSLGISESINYESANIHRFNPSDVKIIDWKALGSFISSPSSLR